MKDAQGVWCIQESTGGAATKEKINFQVFGKYSLCLPSHFLLTMDLLDETGTRQPKKPMMTPMDATNAKTLPAQNYPHQQHQSYLQQEQPTQPATLTKAS